MTRQQGYVDQSQLQRITTDLHPLATEEFGSLNSKHNQLHYVLQNTDDSGGSTKTLPRLSVNQQLFDESGLSENEVKPSSPNTYNQLVVGSGSEYGTNYGFSLALSRSNSAESSPRTSPRSSIETKDSNIANPNVQKESDLSSLAHQNVANYEKVITDMTILDFLRYMPKINLRSLSNRKYVISSKNFEVLKVNALKPNNATQQQILWVKEPTLHNPSVPDNNISQPEKVAFRTMFNSATQAGKLLPDCEKSLPGPHEMFTVVPCTFVDRSIILTHSKLGKKSDNITSKGIQESCLALMSSNGTFVGLEWGSDGESQLASLSRVLSVNELFQPLSQIGIKLMNDSFLSCTNQKKLSTRSTRLGPQEVFTLSFDNGGCSIVTVFNTYLSVEMDGTISAKTPADPSRRSFQEQFQIEVYRIPHKFGDLKFAIKSCYNNYIRVDLQRNFVKADSPSLDDNCLFILRAARLGSLTEFMQDSPLVSHLVSHRNASLISSTESNENTEQPSWPSKSKSIQKKLRDSWLSLFASESQDDDSTETGRFRTPHNPVVEPNPYSTPRHSRVPTSPPNPAPDTPTSTRPVSTKDAYNQPEALLVGVNPDATPASDLRKYDQTPLQEIEDQWKIQWNELKFTKRCLGMGYFGKVMEATWKGTSVACKFIYRENFRSKNEFEMFIHEVKMLTILRHPCICQFLGIAFNEQAYCIVTELLYCSVFDLVREDIYLLHSLPKLRWNIAYNIAQGVCYMHSMDPPILHRDLSSKNVLLQHVSLNAKVADFARAKSEKMSVGTGALQWMAPEVFKGSKYTELCDVFSFAIILYELWIGDDPCAAVCSQAEEGERNLTEYAFKISSGVRPALPPTIPLSWQSLIQQCWDPIPEARPTFVKVIQILHTFPEASEENVSLRGSQIRNFPPFLQQLANGHNQRNSNDIITLDASSRENSSSSSENYQRAPQSLQNFPEISPGSSSGSHYYGEDVPPYLVLDPLASSSGTGSGYASE